MTITGVTITGGTVSCTNTGSGFCNAPAAGLLNFGTATLTNVTLSGNTAGCTNTGSGSCFAGPGGLNNAGTATLTNVTVSENTASCINSNSMGGPCLIQGGGVRNFGTAMLMNVTLSGNTVSCGGGCSGGGGGFFNAGAATLTNVTLSENSTPGCGGCGGGFLNVQTTPEGHTNATVKNTIVANTPSGGNCAGIETTPFASFTSLGHNLSSDASCGFSGPGDLSNTDPKLGPLANNGGPTQTHALLPDSPAIDAVTSGCPPPGTDQRGVARPQGATCDIGAFELGVNVAAVSLNGSAFHTGQPITYEATLIPGSVPPQVDTYLGALLPDGVTFASLMEVSPGVISFALGPSPIPFSANVTLTQAVIPFSYMFNGFEPVVTYFMYAALVAAGTNPFLTSNQISLAVQTFQFNP